MTDEEFERCAFGILRRWLGNATVREIRTEVERV
jgi:hypothetical protein